MICKCGWVNSHRVFAKHATLISHCSDDKPQLGFICVVHIKCQVYAKGTMCSFSPYVCEICSCFLNASPDHHSP